MRVTRLLTALTLLVPLAACSSEPEPGDAANAFAAAFAKGDLKAASGQTDSPDAASKQLSAVRKALEPKSVSAEVKGVTQGDGSSTANATYRVSWDLGGNRTWSYDSHFELRDDDGSWKVHWSPTVIHPKLAQQQAIAVQGQQPELAPVLDRDGGAVLSPSRVVSVLLDKAKAGDVNAVAGALATALSGIDNTITQQAILDGANKTPAGQPYQVAALRQSNYETVKPAIYDLPGVRFTSSPRLLADDKAFAPTVLPGIRKVVEADLTGKAGWRVITTDSTGAEVEELYSKAPQPATAATTTLSIGVQNAAQAAVNTEATPSMIVAMQPSTGELLAVAQNAPADAQGPVALMGRYPPGSTFKIVTATAALSAGKVTGASPVGCPATITIDGREIPNAGKFDKGTIPLSTAFAVSCNTTFAQLASEMGPSDLTNAAKNYGLGVDFVMPGATTVTGSVPAASGIVERAEDGFGQGKVVASPFGMALVVSAVASGKMPAPSLLRGSSTKADATVQPVSPQVLDGVRAMMLEMARSTPALAGFPEVRGKTGTAQFGDGTHSHGWFVGYQGDLAFAVLLTDVGTSAKAVAAATRFLGGLS
ncbi:penicillin-binding transpeptidase domain-containing protein [Actinophytocola sp.]|uniref:penicillin-binding transpeptidase domain-containing protein n=1 Tax=Actinophytocola sp. TaxID=1872138 RepID=UPI002D4CCC58|nr:penicillin-binding transpeptidase domain-containing protein [Actinophytocola sp.]HYQ62420.1 penicillin-binding transpeptidase domain-containing protein [Actinophytocola sp.]